MAVTDPLLGGYSFATPFIYASFLLSVWMGSKLRQTENPLVIGGVALAGSAQFFLISNLGTFLAPSLHPMYPHTFGGLMACFTAAIPFFRNTFLSDLIYTAVLFGAHAFLSRSVPTGERVVALPAAA
jgi:hypothetical protein